MRRGSTGILDSSEASSALWRLDVAVDNLRVSRRLAPLAFAAASGYFKALISKVPQFGRKFESVGTTEPPSSAVILRHSCRWRNKCKILQTVCCMTDSLFWHVMQRRMVVSDLSGQLSGSIFKSRTVLEEF